MIGGEIVSEAFAGVTPDLQQIAAETVGFTLDRWRDEQAFRVTATGAASAAVPVLHLLSMAADLVLLLNRMAVCSLGIGAILGRAAELGGLTEEEDLAVILARWSGEEGVSDAAVAKVCAELVGKVGGKEVTRLLAKKMCEKSGLLIGKKLAGKTGAKIGAKLGAKLSGKAIGGMLPFVGPAISGLVNRWFISELSEVAESWYLLKLGLTLQFMHMHAAAVPRIETTAPTPPRASPPPAPLYAPAPRAPARAAAACAPALRASDRRAEETVTPKPGRFTLDDVVGDWWVTISRPGMRYAETISYLQNGSFFAEGQLTQDKAIHRVVYSGRWALDGDDLTLLVSKSTSDDMAPTGETLVSRIMGTRDDALELMSGDGARYTAQRVIDLRA
jgi:hypothetical protein